jgi:hypothetical protein
MPKNFHQKKKEKKTYQPAPSPSHDVSQKIIDFNRFFSKGIIKASHFISVISVASSLGYLEGTLASKP